MQTASPVALVTGASSGIGRAAALALAGAGFAVVGTSRNAANAGPLAGSMAARVSLLRRIVPSRAFDRQIRKLNRLAG